MLAKLAFEKLTGRFVFTNDSSGRVSIFARHRGVNSSRASTDVGLGAQTLEVLIVVGRRGQRTKGARRLEFSSLGKPERHASHIGLD